MSDNVKSLAERMPGPARKKLTFTKLTDLVKERKRINWLIRDVIECGTHGMLFGDPESGKTLVLFDLLLSIATGSNWRGRPVKQGPVFYLCGEGASGLARRMAAWMVHHNIPEDTDIPFFTSDMPVGLMEESSADEVREVISAMCMEHGTQPVAVGIDTLARNLGPGNENSAQDIGQFIVNIDQYLIGGLGAAVLTSHHTGHGDKDRARGSMSLPGAVDVSYRIVKNGLDLMMECKKCKDFDKPPPFIFKLMVKGLGYQDDYGKEITGATIHPVDDKQFNSGRPMLKGVDGEVFDLLIEHYLATQRRLQARGEENRPPPIPKRYWRDECIKRRVQPHEGPGSPGWDKAKRAVNRSMTKLMDAGHVRQRPTGEDVYPTYLG